MITVKWLPDYSYQLIGKTDKETALLSKLETIDKKQADLMDLLDHARYIGNHRLVLSLSKRIDRLDRRMIAIEYTIFHNPK